MANSRGKKFGFWRILGSENCQKKIIFDICKEWKYDFGKSLVAKNESEQLLFSGPYLEDIGNLQNYMASLEELEIHEIMTSWTV